MKTFHNEPDLVSRREFLRFMGRGALAAASVSSLVGLFTACSTIRPGSRTRHKPSGIEPTFQDELVLAPGLSYSLLLKRGDSLNANDRFGDCADFTTFLPFDAKNPNDGLLWVNHEFFLPLFVSGHNIQKGQKRSRAEVIKEQLEVGGTIARIRRAQGGKWQLVANDSYNRRITARTKIPFAWHKPIAGANHAIGMLGNCAGGVTPWGTILTCEEGYVDFYGDRDFTPQGKPAGRAAHTCNYGWETVFDYAPEHYGWTVEIDPLTGKAKKLVALGRFGKESATVVQGGDGRCVVYSGDDDFDRCIFKFISRRPGSLEEGTLYVANIESGHWIALTRESNSTLKSVFKDETDLLVRARLAGLLAGGTQLDRPEDIEVDPISGAIYVTLTNNRSKGNDFGSILKIEETGSDPTALTFKATTFLTGGPETGFACPDNLVFDRRGDLWFTSDMSSAWLNTEPYTRFGNNGLFFVAMQGPDAGRVVQVASAPVGAELTGPSFSPDGKTLFLSIQHPGEGSRSLAEATSRWPGSKGDLPRSAVVAIEGDLLAT